MEIKTTKEIINNELGVILNSIDYDVNNALFEINKNKKWVSVESILRRLHMIKDESELISLLHELEGE
jgi:RIO-like serine/threonine protein kinase